MIKLVVALVVSLASPTPEPAPKPVIEEPTVRSIAYYDHYEEVETIFSHYWIDGNTSTGKKPKDFQVNEHGMYTYDGKVVVATANTSRWNERPLKDGYYTNNHYDEFEITYQGIKFDAIVLDVCGECYGNGRESKQRVDIFMSKKTNYLIHGAINRYKGLKKYE